MPEYRRAKLEGGTFFFTVITYHRKRILTGERERNILRTAWMDTKERFPFNTMAICLLPNHLHCIWQLPENDSDFSVRWKEIKRLFTKAYLLDIGPGEKRNSSHIKQGEAAIWQRRFWEHTIRDELDFNRHVDYIHHNPVKHGLVKSVGDWPWSTFHRYVREGFYQPDWGSSEELPDDMLIGE
jgi:putative transposase